MIEDIGNVAVNLNAICQRVLQRHAKDIEALNKLQLSKGLRSDEKSLPSYKKSYLKTRRKYGRPLAPMDLNLKGDFYEKFFSIYVASYMNIGSKDPKTGVLEGRFSSNIFGLSDESLNKLLWEMGVAGEIIDEIIIDIMK
jgi:hypothetical protein